MKEGWRAPQKTQAKVAQTHSKFQEPHKAPASSHGACPHFHRHHFRTWKPLAFYTIKISFLALIHDITSLQAQKIKFCVSISTAAANLPKSPHNLPELICRCRLQRYAPRGFRTHEAFGSLQMGLKDSSVHAGFMLLLWRS